MFTTYILPVLLFTGAGAVAGGILVAVSVIFAVHTDPRLDAIQEALPGINCGACGFSGCSSYAKAVLEEGAAVNLCKAGGKATAEAVAAVLGVEAGAVEPVAAVVHCQGHCGHTALKYEFQGTSSCAAANRFYQGGKFCTHSCLGFGDCAAVCPNDAISITDMLASVDAGRCVGCGLCVKACPNQLISIHGMGGKRARVLCASTEMGKITRAVCTSGCIGCKICEKKCPSGAIRVANNLAVVDEEKCTGCGACAEACPSGAILV